MTLNMIHSLGGRSINSSVTRFHVKSRFFVFFRVFSCFLHVLMRSVKVVKVSCLRYRATACCNIGGIGGTSLFFTFFAVFSCFLMILDGG
jgi:hypothetical protein